MTKHLPNHDLFEEAKFIAPFISHSFLCEIERPSTSSLEPKPCPFGHPNVVLDSDRDSTLILHEKSCAMDIPSAPTLQTKKEDPAVEHKDFSFESPPVSCSLLEPLEFVSLKTTCFIRTTTISLSLFASFLEGWLWMHSFIINIADLVEALWY
jgi:hypothetical protein